MPLSPDVAKIVNYFKKDVPKFSQFSNASDYREAINSVFESATNMVSGSEAVEKVEDLTIRGRNGDIRIRVYQQRQNSPVLVYYHGGGFVIGSIETHDAICRRIARISNATVVSVEYRLAPEHKFPVAVEDAYDALKWVTDNSEKIGVDGSKIVVGGDSSGGNLATVSAIIARDAGEDFVKAQILIYPVVNLFSILAPTPSLFEYEGQYGILNMDIMRWFAEQYLKEPYDALNPLASPILANLENLPPALIITAEYDPLRDEGEMYGHKLQKAGTPTTIVRYKGAIHSFLNFYPIVKAGKDAIAQVASVLIGFD